MIFIRFFTVCALCITLIISGCQSDSGPVSPELNLNELIVSLTANPAILPNNDPDATSAITATVTDKNGIPIGEGIVVSFSTTIGIIAPTDVTNSDGQATVVFRPDDQTGDGEIYGFVGDPNKSQGGHAGILVADPTIPVFIEVEAFPNFISVSGTGQNQVSALTATVRNALGEPVMAEREVLFALINEPDPPEGATINGSVEQVDESLTVDGVAIGYLVAGTMIGGKVIRVSTEIDNQNIISSFVSGVAVVSGPAFQLDIDVNNFGYDAGGGLWMIEASARVWDIHRNPVRDNIAVVFSLEPQVATITLGVTANENRNGISTPGTAYARIFYNSVNTFSPIEISAVVRTEQGEITGARDYVLPLQRGKLELNVDPANWMFEDGREDAQIRCWVVLNDGHGITINNAPILFSSNRASFGWVDLNNQLHMYFPDPVRKYTGVRDQQNDEEPGQATVFLIAEETDIFLDPFTLEVSVRIDASVEGYSDVGAAPKWIAFTRSSG